MSRDPREDGPETGAAPARMVAVWCPDWPVLAAGADLGAPVAVVHANRVVACSPAAREEGVVPGLRRRQAQERCPDLALLAHDPERDGVAFEPVLAAVERLTPSVEVGRPGSCAFPARGAARWHGGEDRLRERLTEAVDAVLGGPGRCRVGIADGRFAAGLAAREGTTVAPGASRAFLAGFGVTTLELPDLTDVLDRLGLRTLGALAELPAAMLGARFGLDGTRAHRLASGLDLEPPARRRPPPDLTERAELDPPVERSDMAAFAARALADRLCERLDDRGMACARLRVELHTEHGEAHARSWRLDAGGTGVIAPAPYAGATAAAIVDRVRWQLDGWLGSDREGAPTAGVTLVLLVPEEVVPAAGCQLGFWGEEAGERDRAARAFTRAQALLGAGAVLLARVRGGRDPTDRAAPAPLPGAEPVPPDPDAPRPPTATDGPRLPGAGTWGTAPPRDRRATPADGPPPWPGQVPPPAPAVVYAEPLPTDLRGPDGLPVTVDGYGLLDAVPTTLAVSGHRPATVATWSAPWPLDERWWDPRRHRRAARLQVTTESGDGWLLYLIGGRWWAIGRYD